MHLCRVVHRAGDVPITGYKLFLVRRDRSVGWLLMNRKQRQRTGETYLAEDHPPPVWHTRQGNDDRRTKLCRHAASGPRGKSRDV